MHMCFLKFVVIFVVGVIGFFSSSVGSGVHTAISWCWL